MTGLVVEDDEWDLPGETPLTIEQLTELVCYLATKWPELSVNLDENDEIVSVTGLEKRAVGRPTSSKSAFKQYAEIDQEGGKSDRVSRCR